MKKLFVLFIVLIPLVALAWNTAIIGGGVPEGGSCSTPTGSELSEGFEGAGYEDGMVDNSGSPDEDETTFLGAAPSGVCSQVLRTTAIDGAESSSEYDTGTDIDLSSTDVDIEFAFYIDSASDFTDYSNTIIFALDNDTASDWNTIGDFRLRFQDGPIWTVYFDGTGSNSSYITISIDTWYVVKLHFDSTTPADSYVQLTGGSSTTCDEVDECKFAHSDETDFQYLRVGPSNISGIFDVDMVTGYITIDEP